MSHQQTWRKDQLISRSKRITLGVDLIEENPREQAASTKSFPRIRNGFTT
jgi:hypothetical protein